MSPLKLEATAEALAKAELFRMAREEKRLALVGRAREELISKPVKLPLHRMPISLTHTVGHDGGGIKLEWSTPLQPRQSIQTKCLYP